MTRVSLTRYNRKAADRTMTRATALPDVGGIYDGTVGWEDGEDHFELDPDTGITLVKVTLFRGRNPDTDPEKKTSRAKGKPILCRISAPLFTVPPDGSAVHVSIPAGRWDVVGAGVIIAQVTPGPKNQFDAAKSKMDFGPDYDLVIKARSITLTDYEDRYFTLGPKYGIKMGDADANGCQLKDAEWKFYTTHTDGNASTTLMLSRANGFGLFHDDGKKTCMVMKSGEWMGIGDSFKALFGAGYLGVATTPLVPTSGIAYSAAGPVNVVSPSWYVSTT